jgi:hypothetical protein
MFRVNIWKIFFFWHDAVIHIVGERKLIQKKRVEKWNRNYGGKLKFEGRSSVIFIVFIFIIV